MGPRGSAFCLLVAPAVLSGCLWAADGPLGRGDFHSLQYDFNISSNKQPWCMVQGQMDEKNYLLYDCGSNKVITVNLLREEVQGTNAWRGKLSTLKEVGEWIKELLPDIKQEKYSDGVHITLQVKAICQLKANGNTNGYLEYFLDGQRFLAFDSETGEYRADNSKGEQMKKKWENNKDLNKFFKYISEGDCKEWVHLLLCWKKEQEPTATATATATTPSKATANTPIAWILTVSLTCWMTAGILG